MPIFLPPMFFTTKVFYSTVHWLAKLLIQHSEFMPSLYFAGIKSHFYALHIRLVALNMHSRKYVNCDIPVPKRLSTFYVRFMLILIVNQSIGVCTGSLAKL